MLLQLILFAVTCGFLYLSRHQSAFSPVRMFLYGWLVVLGTAVSGMVRYDRPFAGSTFLLVLATLCAFVAGAYFASRRSHVRQRPFGQPRDDFDRLTLSFLCALASVGAAMVLRDLLGGGLALLANYSTELYSVRNDLWRDFAAGNIDVSPLRSVGTVSCLAVATLLPYATCHRRRLLQFASAAAATVVALDSFLSGGRFVLGVLALCLLVSATLVYGGKSVRRIFTMRRLLIGGAIAGYFFVVFPTQRNPYLTANLERSLWQSTDAHFAGWVTDTAALPGMAWLKVFANSTSYFSTSLDKLNYFNTETDVFSWYKLGLYNITQISQFAGAVGDEAVTPWYKIRLDIAAIMSSEGWAVNPWSTGIRDLGIDFGLFAVLATGILGFLAQFVYGKSVASSSYIGLITATYVSVACLIFAFISPFQIRIISNGFWLLAVFALARYILEQAVDRRTSGSSFVPSLPS